MLNGTCHLEYSLAAWMKVESKGPTKSYSWVNVQKDPLMCASDPCTECHDSEEVGKKYKQISIKSRTD